MLSSAQNTERGKAYLWGMAMINIHRTTLSNGLRVVVCPDHASPNVTVDVMYHVGSFDERPDRTGLAHLFEHLMFDNTTTGVLKQYDTLCTKAGGSNNAYTTYDYTNYYINLPAHQAELGMWLEAERMKAFMITDHALETQRSVVIEEINQNVNNTPYGRWRFAQQAEAFDAASSYSWEVYGSADDVAAVSMDDAKGFFQTYYQPANAVLCVAGDITPETAYALAERQFGSIPQPATPITRNTFDVSWKRSGGHVVQPDAVTIPAVFLSFHMPGDREMALQSAEVASTLLGAGRTSALYRSLVSDKRLASSVGSYVDRRDHTTLFTLYAFAATPDITPSAMASEIMATVESFAPSNQALLAATNKLATSTAMELQRNSGVADAVAWHTLFKDDPEYVNTLVQRYKAVSNDDVVSVLRSYLRPANGVRVDVVPE